MNIKEVKLCGKIIRLEPMKMEDIKKLAKVGLAKELWKYQPREITTESEMEIYVKKALDEQKEGSSLPFTIVEQQNNQVIGSTRFLDISPQNRRLEIGATWLTPSSQHTGANTEAKLLLLTHAFETLGTIRVVLKTEVLNEQSRKAILRIGAVEEGIFRNHLIADSGRIRSMVFYSILDNEWPIIKDKLSSMLSLSSKSPV